MALVTWVKLYVQMRDKDKVCWLKIGVLIDFVFLRCIVYDTGRDSKRLRGGEKQAVKLYTAIK